MGLFSNFPYSDFENINLDWIIKNVKEYILKYESLEKFVNLSIEEQNKIIEEALKTISDKLQEIDEAFEELRQYIINNLRPIANEIINELIESGELYVGTTYNAETEELNIVLSREE